MAIRLHIPSNSPVTAPIPLPRRSSSLAFLSRRPSQLAERANTLVDVGVILGDHDTTRSNADGKRSAFPTPTLEIVHPGHVAQMQKVFQTVQATLHQDIQAAISPVGSIEARMHLDSATPLTYARARSLQAKAAQESAKAWRYSLAPEVLAANAIDVREPLPFPALPALPCASPTYPISEEPMSSGFSTPRAPTPVEEMVLGEAEETDQLVTELDQPLRHLTVSGNENSDPVPSTESQTTRDPSCASMTSSMDVAGFHSPKGGIVLPEVAEAAAHSARAKRRILRQDLFISEDNDVEDVVICSDPRLHVTGAVLCPDPEVHQSPPIAAYDGMMSYHHLHTPALVPRPVAAYGHDGIYSADTGYIRVSRERSGPEGARATATGSPMPFERGARKLDVGSQYPSPTLYLAQRGDRSILLDRHFQPGWYRAKCHLLSPTARGTYSFSTAAAKVRDEDQAPDRRMRDSYKTDTLTALPELRARYRRNGIGATIPPRSADCHYQGRPQGPSFSGERRPGSRRTYDRASDVRFRSSPPRAVPETHKVVQRKRAADDNFLVAEGRMADLRDDPALQLRPSDEVIKLDDQTRAAIRMSIFGTSTPEALHNARQGIRELSPNVQIYRRDHPRSRKKRRPSYWDQGLRDVRASLAGHGGTESPASVKQSLTAEFEVASLDSGEGDVSEATDDRDQENISSAEQMIVEAGN